MERKRYSMGRVRLSLFFNTEQFPEKVPGLNVEQGNHHKNGIENTNARKVPERPEVGDAFCFFFVENPNRHGGYRYSLPGGSHNHFNFKLEPTGEKLHFLQRPEGIQAIAALCVFHFITRLQPVPEI